jgi:hypothetical protein
VITRFPAEELLVTGKTYVRGADLLQASSGGGANGGDGVAAPASGAGVLAGANRPE